MERMNGKISWLLGFVLFFGSTAGATESEIAESLKNFGEGGSVFSDFHNSSTRFNSTVVYADPGNSIKLNSVKNDLLKLELELNEFQTNLANIGTAAANSPNIAENDFQKDIEHAILKLEGCVNTTQRLHAESANIAFLAKTDKRISAQRPASEISAVTIRLSGFSQSLIAPSANRLRSIARTQGIVDASAEMLWKIGDIQRHTHNLTYHLLGIHKAAEDLLASSGAIGRPGFPIPIPFPPYPYHPPINPPHPSTPTSDAIEECKDDCNYQYDADCESCSDYVTDPRALALCYSSAADRQGTCIRNCYRN